MSNTAHVVEGEASESDSEVEIGESPDVDLSAKSTMFVITGEAPESDDELTPSKTVQDGMHSATPSGTVPPSPSKIMYDSLLHQKLWECNVSLRATVEGLVKHTTDISVEKLTRADKILLNVQESMRATNANLAVARTRLKQIQAELEKANCSSAFPTVKVRL